MSVCLSVGLYICLSERQRDGLYYIMVQTSDVGKCLIAPCVCVCVCVCVCLCVHHPNARQKRWVLAVSV